MFESSWRLLNDSDELMAENPRVWIIATNQFEISIANPCLHYADENGIIRQRLLPLQGRKPMIYDKVPEEECWRSTGKGPITTKRVYINKGDGKNPKYRPRNLAREIAYKKQDGSFVATPPMEVMKLLISATATANKGERIMVSW